LKLPINRKPILNKPNWLKDVVRKRDTMHFVDDLAEGEKILLSVKVLSVQIVVNASEIRPSLL